MSEEPEISDEAVQAYDRAYEAYSYRYDLSHAEEARERSRAGLAAAYPILARKIRSKYEDEIAFWKDQQKFAASAAATIEAELDRLLARPEVGSD